MSKQLHSLYCDDIRLEVGNKLSFMGTYGEHMIVPGFPFDIPRLNVIMRVCFYDDEPPSGPFRAVVLLNDQEIVSNNVDAEEGPAEPLQTPVFEGATDVQEYRVISLFFPLSQLRIEGPSILRPRVIFENETLRGDGLCIITQPE